MLANALHCIYSLVSTATNSSPHYLLLRFGHHFRPQPLIITISAGNYAWLRRHVRGKNDSSGDHVKVVASYPAYAVISRDGTTTDTVNWRHLAPHPEPAIPQSVPNNLPEVSPTHTYHPLKEQAGNAAPSLPLTPTTTDVPPSSLNQSGTTSTMSQSASFYKTQHGRIVKPPVRFGCGENVE